MTTAILRLQEAGRGGEEGGEAEPGLVSVPLLEKAEPRLGRRHLPLCAPIAIDVSADDDADNAQLL